MEQSLALSALAALAHETRLNLVRLLVPAGPGGLAQGEIARRLAVSASRLAFHLALLEQAGLVTARREGRSVYYAASTSGLGAVLSYVLNDCCAAHPEVRDCCGRTPGAAS
jgi:ArsR family transcriptional regulator, arsenate/arsenite/antimonite-responsive transcriptional repressor